MQTTLNLQIGWRKSKATADHSSDQGIRQTGNYKNDGSSHVQSFKPFRVGFDKKRSLSESSQSQPKPCLCHCQPKAISADLNDSNLVTPAKHVLSAGSATDRRRLLCQSGSQEAQTVEKTVFRPQQASSSRCVTARHVLVISIGWVTTNSTSLWELKRSLSQGY